MVFVSKISKARELFEANPGLSRNELVAKLEADLSLNAGTALTYYYNLVKGNSVEAKKPVPTTPVVAAEPKKRGRPAKPKEDAVLASLKAGVEEARQIVKERAVAKPNPRIVEKAFKEPTGTIHRGVDPNYKTTLDIDFAKDPKNWAKDMVKAIEEVKNLKLFGAK